MGGKFASGFISAAAAKFASTYTRIGDLWGALEGDGVGKMLGRTTVATVVGETVSSLSGGDFANGAYTAAFQHLFNAEMASKFNKVLSKTKKLFDKQKAIWDKREAALVDAYGKMGYGADHHLTKRALVKFGYTKLQYFGSMVGTGRPLGIKQGDFHPKHVGEWSTYNGDSFRYDDYGNYNYGYAARLFGISLDTAIKAPGLIQIKQTLLGTSKIGWGNYEGWLDDPRDTQMIKRGYNHGL